ncbi:MAG: hypothetical protein ABSB60_18550 [Terracidiphilus sp.]|jgi:hypothetical protein
MKAKTVLLVVVLSLACGATQAEEKSSQHKCPIAIKSVKLSYNHQGGESKPQLGMEFESYSDKRISNIVFTLLILDAFGNAHPYPDDLTYPQDLEPGKKAAFVWDLESAAVDIHRTGETLVVKKVGFIDATSWNDGGLGVCGYTVDYHAR